MAASPYPACALPAGANTETVGRISVSAIRRYD